MLSVTARCKIVKQPYGGYLSVKLAHVKKLQDEMVLAPKENIHGILIGIAVDYLTRREQGTPSLEAFAISIEGASRIKEKTKAEQLANQVTGLDDHSIVCACKLAGYDVLKRSGPAYYKPVDNIKPDEDTIGNIRILVQRNLRFFREYGPIIWDGFTFEGGYTPLISSGDGDYLTKDCLWDCKIFTGEIGSKQTLQLLIYYVMGMHSIHEEFRNIKHLGIYNPRKNKVYLWNLDEIPRKRLDDVAYDVIGYIPEYAQNEENGRSKALEMLKKERKYICSPGEEAKDVKGQVFQVGDRVIHPNFGEGIVTEIEQLGSKESLYRVRADWENPEEKRRAYPAELERVKEKENKETRSFWNGLRHFLFG